MLIYIIIHLANFEKIFQFHPDVGFEYLDVNVIKHIDYNSGSYLDTFDLSPLNTLHIVSMGH